MRVSVFAPNPRKLLPKQVEKSLSIPSVSLNSAHPGSSKCRSYREEAVRQKSVVINCSAPKLRCSRYRNHSKSRSPENRVVLAAGFSFPLERPFPLAAIRLQRNLSCRRVTAEPLSGIMTNARSCLPMLNADGTLADTYKDVLTMSEAPVASMVMPVLVIPVVLRVIVVIPFIRFSILRETNG